MPVLWPGGIGPACNYISPPPPESFCAAFPRRLAILGSTGSIGRNALEIAARHRNRLRIAALAGGRNVELLAKQALEFEPALLAVQDVEARNALTSLLPPSHRPEILIGASGYANIAAHAGVDMLLSAQSGAAGLVGTLAALLAGKPVALANKESLVLAGELCRAICQKTGAAILPVDSEHFALFQCLCGRSQNAVKLILTASGGPFRNMSAAELCRVESSQALRHPRWSMGAKISIDSATLMNKGLEIIEAMHLFGASVGNIEVLVHPQSIIHSMVLFQDNGLLAQMAAPDMKLPIAACLLWPEMPLAPVPPLDLARLGCLEFAEPDLDRFPCLAIARAVADAGGSARIVMNAANEEAVALFMRGEIGFCDIPALVEKALAHFEGARAACGPDFYAGAEPAQEALRLWEGIARLDSETRNFAKKL